MPAHHLPNLGGWEQHISEFAYEAALNAYNMALTATEEGSGPVYPPSDQILPPCSRRLPSKYM